MSQPASRSRPTAWIVQQLALPLLLGTAPLAGAQFAELTPPGKGIAGPAPSASPTVTLDLADCLSLALQRQPRLAAQRASLAAAEDGCRALDNLKVPAVLDPEIPIRRRQAALGVTAAAAGLDQAERETIYAVTRTYFTVLYAREQERVARSIVERLSAIHSAAKQQLDAGAREMTATDVNRALVYLRLAQTRRTQATQGVKRALEALREAIGLACDVNFDVAPGRLPVLDVRPCRDDIVALALARRGEMVRANIFVEVTCLEVEAQGVGLHKRMETFAAGSDIHGIRLPAGSQDSEYRPGAVAPEMPTLLVGSRPDRVKRAQSFHARARAVAETTHNLIVLEAEDAHLRWEEASVQVPDAREAADTADKNADSLTKSFLAAFKVKVEEVVNARVLASQARSQYNEYLYKQILALADLERITAGGFHAGLVEAIAPGKQAGPGNGQPAK
jgi:outer membrane protein TolC